MENTENKITSIKIRQVPHCVDIAMAVLMIMLFFVSFSLKGSEQKEMSDIIFGLAVIAVFFTGLVCCSVCRTKVTFGEGSIIRCRWLFLSMEDRHSEVLRRHLYARLT